MADSKLAEAMGAISLGPLLNTTEAVASVVSRLLEDEAQVAVDCEGRDLCRNGTLDLLQLSNGSSTWLVDVATLGDAAFEAGRLRELLESETVLKVVFDGRADADALYHLYQTRLCNAYDLQVASCRRQDHIQGRRDRFLHGLGRAMGVYLQRDPKRARRLTLVKEAGLKLFAPEKGGRYEVWAERPLAEALVTYATADVDLLLEMKTAWERHSPVEENTAMTALRLRRAVDGPNPAKGKHMAMKDF
jgi:exonuclease 3'-5' domain-containing protein 1